VNFEVLAIGSNCPTLNQLSQPDGAFSTVLLGDRLLRLVHGEVIAGIESVQPGDVAVRDHNISLRLRGPTSSARDSTTQKSRVYSRDAGLFLSAGPNLETEVRHEGERQLQQSALQDGILAAADRNARNTMKSFLQGLGFNQVAIQEDLKRASLPHWFSSGSNRGHFVQSASILLEVVFTVLC
jgi:hypothetical protein